MSRKLLVLTVTLLLVVPFGLFGTVRAGSLENQAAQPGGLPTITFLGEGPQTFTIDPPLMFLVKTYVNGEFVFTTADPPTYEAEARERVWTIDFLPTDTESLRLFGEERSYGEVEAGCVVNYVQLDDNVDNRRNSFFVNGSLVQTVEQGMVTYGSFTAPETGELTFFAEDSVGLIVELCPVGTPAGPIQTGTPEETPPALTGTPPATGTSAPPTALPSATATATAVPPTATLPPTAVFEEPTFTPTEPAPTQTFTATATTGVTATPGGAQPTQPAPTNTPVEAQVAQPTPTATMTQTPIPTPSVIPVTGGGPGPREIAWMGGALLAGLGLLAGAWWVLLRRLRHEE